MLGSVLHASNAFLTPIKFSRGCTPLAPQQCWIQQMIPIDRARYFLGTNSSLASCATTRLTKYISLKPIFAFRSFEGSTRGDTGAAAVDSCSEQRVRFTSTRETRWNPAPLFVFCRRGVVPRPLLSHLATSRLVDFLPCALDYGKAPPVYLVALHLF